MKTKILVVLSLALMLSACGTPAEQNTFPAADLPSNPLQDKPAPSADFQVKLGLTTDISEVKTGDAVTVSILISGAKQPVTTANTELLFDPQVWEVSSIDAAQSAFSLAFKNEFDNEQGTVTVHRSHSQGVTGDNNLLAKVILKAKQAGQTTLRLNPDATVMLLTNNARVTPALSDFPETQLTVR